MYPQTSYFGPEVHIWGLYRGFVKTKVHTIWVQGPFSPSPHSNHPFSLGPYGGCPYKTQIGTLKRTLRVRLFVSKLAEAR